MIERLERQVEKERRDLRVLGLVLEEGPVGIGRIADQTGLAQHKVRYSLRMLENDGLVDPTPQGAVPADDIDERVATINEGFDRLVDRLQRIADGVF